MSTSADYNRVSFDMGQVDLMDPISPERAEAVLRELLLHPPLIDGDTRAHLSDWNEFFARLMFLANGTLSMYQREYTLYMRYAFTLGGDPLVQHVAEVSDTESIHNVDMGRMKLELYQKVQEMVSNSEAV
jgi:hypothetical protein